LILALLCLYQLGQIGRLSRELGTSQSTLEAARTRLENAEKRAVAAEQSAQNMANEQRKPDASNNVSSASEANVPKTQYSSPSRGIKGIIFASQMRFPAGVQSSKQLKEQNLLQNMEWIDRAYQPAYARLGLTTPEQQGIFLKLKIQEFEARSAERQAVVNRMLNNSEARDQALAEVAQKVHAEFIENVRKTFGDQTANAVDQFESAQQSTANQLNATGAFGNTDRATPAPNP